MSDYITWMCSTSAKCNSKFICLFFFFFLEIVKEWFCCDSTLCGCCNFASGCSFMRKIWVLVSHLHQLKSTDCYHPSYKCMIAFILRCTKYCIFEIAKEAVISTAVKQVESTFGTFVMWKHVCTSLYDGQSKTHQQCSLYIGFCWKRKHNNPTPTPTPPHHTHTHTHTHSRCSSIFLRVSCNYQASLPKMSTV